MKVDTYKCDHCGKIKGETNHWWLSYGGDSLFTLLPWSAEVCAGSGVRHYCGEACVVAKVGDFMHKGNQES